MTAASQRHADFGERVRRRRRALDWTQAQLAERVGCSEDMVRKVESGARRPSRWLAERLARHLQFDDGAAPPAPRVVAPPAVDVPTLVGRDTEMGLLRNCIDTARGGRGALVLVEGEPGIGKSHLARAALAAFERAGLRSSAAVACYEIDRAIPLQPWIDWMHRLLNLLGPERITALSAAARAELAELSPQVRELEPALAAMPVAPELRRARIFSAFDELVGSRLRDGPLLIVIDDIHWADEMTLALLHRLVRQTGARPLLVVCTYRIDEMAGNAALALFVRSALADLAATRLTLPRLGEADVQRLLDARGSAAQPGLAQRLYRSSEGHPLYLASLLQQLRDADDPAGQAALPAALRDSIVERLRRLPEPARAVLEMAAVLGRRFDVFALERGSGMAGEALADAVDLLVQRHLLREFDDGASLDFDHHRIREVVVDGLGTARRIVLHRRAAEALAGADGDNSAAIARHLEAAGDWGGAIAQHAQAAQRLLGLSALREAAAAIDRAVELAAAHAAAIDAAERVRLHALRGEVHAQDGQCAVAVAAFEAALAGARGAGDSAQTFDLLAKLGMAHRRADDYAAAHAALADALAASRALGEPQRVADALYHLGTVAWSDGDNALALRCHVEAVELCETHVIGGVVAVQAWHGAGESQMSDALPQRAIERFERSLALARAIGDRGHEAENIMMIGFCSLGATGTADYARALACARDGLAVAEAAGQAWHVGPLHLLQADAWRCTGRTDEAQALLEAEIERSRTLAHARFGIMALDILGRLFDEAGRHAEAQACWQRALDDSRRHRVNFWRAQLLAGHAQARLHQGLDVDWNALDAASEDALARGERYVHARCLAVLAEGALAARDSARARDRAERLLALAQPAGMRELEATACWLIGCAALDTSPAHAFTQFHSALAIAQRIDRPWLAQRLQACLVDGGGGALLRYSNAGRI